LSPDPKLKVLFVDKSFP